MNEDRLKSGPPNGSGPFFRELAVAASLTGLTIAIALWPILSAPNSSYPDTVDALGHMAKIKYIADSLRQWHIPSWFPYWYSGSAVTQYYPPLSYWLLIPIQLLFSNVMITFKAFLFASVFVGSIGVWCFNWRFVGPRTGVVAAVIYAIQPYLLRSLVLHGLIAQGPIYALSPWLLVFTMLFLERPGWKRWLAVCVTVMLLVLSHAMHAFLVAIFTGLVVLVLCSRWKAGFQYLVSWAVAVAGGAGLAAFWWVPGVTQLDTPGIPFLMPEVAETFTANVSWFLPQARRGGGFYFSLLVLLLAAAALWPKVWPNKDRRLLIALEVSSVGSVVLSFGKAIPLFRFIPMASSLVPGRSLSYASLATALLSAVTITQLGLASRRTGNRLAVGFLVILALWDLNPFAIGMATDPYLSLQKSLDVVSPAEKSFDRGRFTWITPAGSEMTYFPMIHSLNIAEGWNIEGTLHNRAIWQHNIAIAVQQDDYVIDNLLQWNVRSLFVDEDYPQLVTALKAHGFREVSRNGITVTLVSLRPSTYFMKADRDGVAIGAAARNLVMYFPWLIEGRSPTLEDYADADLAGFRLIYLAEPKVRNPQAFEAALRKLALAGKTVIVEYGRSRIWSVLGTYAYWDKITQGILEPVPGSPFKATVPLQPDPLGQSPVVAGLDGVWYEAEIEDSALRPGVGYKTVENGRVFFVNDALSQSLGSPYGSPIKEALGTLMDLVSPNKELAPAPFPITGAQWSYNGCTFHYTSDKPDTIWVSVTYSSRWKATVDGTQIPVRNLSNLIALDVPQGEHEVVLEYGMSWVAWAGVALSGFAALLVLMICVYFGRLGAGADSVQRWFDRWITTWANRDEHESRSPVARNGKRG